MADAPESEPGTEPEPEPEREPEVVTIVPVTTAVVWDVIPVSGLRDFFDSSFGALARALAAQGVQVLGPAFGRYRGAFGETDGIGNDIDVEVGFVTDRAVDKDGAVLASALPGGRVARFVHVGGFDGLASSWVRLHAWIQGHGLTSKPDRWEVYVTQPTPDMDPADLRTELTWPVEG